MAGAAGGISQRSHRPHPPARDDFHTRAFVTGFGSARMKELSKIPCTVITGFLGAGKTTLVRHLLENASGRRLAVLVNEFGDLGFDGSFLAGCGIAGCSEEDIVELPNGCIC